MFLAYKGFWGFGVLGFWGGVASESSIWPEWRVLVFSFGRDAAWTVSENFRIGDGLFRASLWKVAGISGFLGGGWD